MRISLLLAEDICVIPHGAIKFCMAKNQQNVYIAEIVCGILMGKNALS